MTEHPFRIITKVMREAEITGVYPRVLLLCGNEDFLISWACGYLEAGLINPACAALDCIRFTDEEADAGGIIEACETLPLLSSKKLVIADISAYFEQGRSESSEGSDKLCEYIPQSPESTILVLTCPKPNKTRSLYKTIAKHGLVFDFVPLDRGTLAAWMNKRLSAAGKTASREDLLRFADACGYGDKDSTYKLWNMENDLKKVVAISEKPQISLGELMACVPARAETDAFKLLDSAFSGNRSTAFSVLNDSLDLSQPSKAMGVILGFTGLVISQLEIMVEAAERKAEGQSYQTIVSAMGINEYRLKKAMQASSGLSPAKLREDLFRAYQLEKDIKDGLMDGKLALELFIAGL